MEVHRENIFGLLGGDNKKYHSCVLTSFTFDFSFFEMQGMRALKNAGIRNVLVLLDESKLNELTANPTGLEFTRNTGYGLYPIKASAVFHSKLLLCAGAKEGFVAIGSGNLTAAGHGSNHELWSVFHVKDVNTPNAILFRQVCQYIEQLTKRVKGNSAEKLKWFFQYAPWIGKIQVSPVEDFIDFKNERIKLIPIEDGFQGLRAISESITDEDIEEIEVLSPYYDQDGELLYNLQSLFPVAQLKVVLDLEYGLLPYDLHAAEDITFYDWHKCIEQEDDISRLHGKLLVFRSKSGAEYFLIGSANATTFALGTMSRGAKNKELGLLVRRKKGGIFKELGIDLKTEAEVDLRGLEKREMINVFETSSREVRPLSIEVVEEDNGELFIKTFGNYSGEIHLSFYDRFARIVGQFTVEAVSEEFKFRIPVLDGKLKKAFYVSWNSTDGLPLSNRQIIQGTAIHNKCNPDPENERIESVFDEIESGHFGKVADLLRYVTFDSDDENSIPTASIGNKPLKDASIEKEFVISPTYEDFTSVSQESLLKQKGLLISPNLRIVDFLASIRKRQLAFQAEKGIRADEQIIDIEGYEGEADEELEDAGSRTLKDCQKEQKAIQRHLKLYSGHLTKKLEKLIKEELAANSSPITITDYSNFLIASQLVVHYTELPFEDSQNTVRYQTFLKAKGEKPYDNLKTFCQRVLGAFLLLQRKGDKRYEFERLENKRSQFKRDAFFYSTFLICNAYWRTSEREIRLMLLINTTLNLLSEKGLNSKKILTELTIWIEEKIKEGIYVSPYFHEQFNDFKDSLFPIFVRAARIVRSKEKTIVPTAKLRAGLFVYNSKLGVSYVKKNKLVPKYGHNKLTLVHPGFLKRDTDGDQVFSMLFKKNVIFEI